MPRRETGHERFKKLCALTQARTLSAAEQEELGRHLKSCQLCRELCREYALMTETAMPMLRALSGATAESAGWDNSRLRQRLLATLRKQRRRMTSVRTISLDWLWNALKMRIRF